MQERLKQITHYIENYEKNKNSNVLNYYRIFELTESNDINFIMESIKNKKLKILFHPDLLAYIPEQHKKSFKILSDGVKDIENIFSNSKSRLMYDEKLKRATIEINKEKTEPFRNTSDLDQLNNITFTNIQKHGFKFTSEALVMIIRYENFKGITNTNGSREKANVLGKKKIETILNFFTPKNSKGPNLYNKIINYFSYIIHQSPELKEKLDAYINACFKTASKYDFEQVEYAINNVLKNYSNDQENKKIYTGFTNNESARENLQKLVNPDDIVILSRVYLNINRRDRYQNDELSTLSDQQIIGEFLRILEEEFVKQNTTHHHR